MRWNNKQISSVRHKRQRRLKQLVYSIEKEFIEMIKLRTTDWTGHESAAGLN